MDNKQNKKYYEKGKIDFLTFANDINLSEANVLDFISRAKLCRWYEEKELIIWEFGVGAGEFAYNFLNILEKKDKKLFRKVNYKLFDFSKKLLDKSKKKLTKFRKKTEFELYDAMKDIPKGKANYIRINELWDDLPAKIFYKKKGKIYEKQLGEIENTTAKAFLECLPEGYEIVINDYAAFHLSVLASCLAKGGYIDVFDYGFRTIDLPKQIWNLYLKRETNHTTYDVNFIYLKAIADHLGFKQYLEPQDQYVNETLGKTLFVVELKDKLYYMTKKEMQKNAKIIEKNGYSKEFIEGKIKEENNYFHLRLWK